MPLDISTGALLEKNKMNSDSTWLLLVAIQYESEPTVRICLNNEEVTWDGNTYYPAIFELSGLVETKDAEVPTVPLTFVDVERVIIPSIEEFDGGIGSIVTLNIVNSKYLHISTPELQEVMEIIECSFDDKAVVQLKLGAEDLSNKLCPPNRYLKNHCRFAFKGSRCGYSGGETECNRTLARCKELGNSVRFGGCPGIGTSGVQI